MSDKIDAPAKIHDMQWEFLLKTPFGNNLYLGFNNDTKEYSACSDAPPWFFVPANSLKEVQSLVESMLRMYDAYLKEQNANKC